MGSKQTPPAEPKVEVVPPIAFPNEKIKPLPFLKKDKATKSESRYKLDIEIISLQKRISFLINSQYGDSKPKDVLNGMIVKSRM